LPRVGRTTEVIKGQHNGYFWAEWQTNCSKNFDRLIRDCPEFVVGKYGINTSFDSGKLAEWPVAAALQRTGWRFDDHLAYSPRITDPSQVPIGQPYVEWYFFESRPRRIRHIPPFVNWGAFSVAENIAYGGTIRFWDSMKVINPYSYMAESLRMSVIVRNEDVFRLLMTRWGR
jgi:hypothetical protein